MKKENHTPHRFESLSDAHRHFGLPKPKHPLISLMKGRMQFTDADALSEKHVLSFYKISFKPRLEGRIEYGQGHYDFDEGGLLFAAPGQIIGGSTDDTACSEYSLLVHPDFFLGYPLAKKIRNYGFFSYTVKETLHLSEEEKNIILSVFSFMESELNNRIDDFSNDVMISQMELLLTYADRFYKRQFITRQAVSNDLLQKFETLLDNYFKDELSLNNGIPTVSYFADQLNLSASYLSDMLRSLTGQSTQQHIHDRLIYEAKEILSTTSLSVGEVAYKLGFEHS
ncbi:MAG: helix-turn-helix domain-containing protein, partial [Chryseobacterium sp.]